MATLEGHAKDLQCLKSHFLFSFFFSLCLKIRRVCYVLLEQCEAVSDVNAIICGVFFPFQNIAYICSS